MDRRIERRLMRRLHGELSTEEVRRLDELLERDADLRTELERLAALWRGLEGPSPALAPTDFAAQVLERLEASEESTASWPLAVRWAASAMVVGGIALGVFVGRWAVIEEAAIMLQQPPSLAESYFALLESTSADQEEAVR